MMDKKIKEERLKTMKSFKYIKLVRDLSNNIKKFRGDFELSQQQIANNIGIDRSTYAYYETGKSLPCIFTLIAISNKFHVNPVYLLIKNCRDLYWQTVKNKASTNTK